MLEFYWSILLRDSCMSSCMVFRKADSAIHTLPHGYNNHRIELMKEQKGILTRCKKGLLNDV